MATMLETYIDVDVAGGAGDGSSLENAYDDLANAEAGEQQDLVTSDEYMNFYCYSTESGIDTNKCTLAGWTTGAGTTTPNSVRISCPQKLTSMTGLSTSIYRRTTDNDDNIVIQINYCSIIGIQASIINGDNTSDIIFDGSYVAGTSVVTIDQCYAYAGESSVCTCYSFQDSEQTFYIRSSIGIATSTGRATYFVANTGYIYNCDFTGGASGFRSGTTGTYTIANCVVFATADDFIIGAGSTVTIDYCASDDGDGTNAIAPSGGNWANEIPNYATDDWSPSNTGNIYLACATRYIQADFTGLDFNASTPTCGAIEYVGGGTEYNETLSETINFSESMSNTKTVSATLSETVNFSESQSNAKTVSETLSETVNFSESETEIKTVSELISDIVNLSESVTGTIEITARLSDAITISESLQSQAEYGIVLSDTIRMTDLLSLITNGVVKLRIAVAEKRIYIDAAETSVKINVEEV